ncbi:hypothetical protein FS837_006772 [Tulasnella sp. UAMH 9824]|nr:hypothetical protein FS837_006772 [Tulasnella sp. UAMH 9824]
MASYNPQNGQHPPLPAAPFTFVLPTKEDESRSQLQRKRSREDDDGEYDIHPEYRDGYDDHNIHNASPGDMPLSIGDEEELGGSPLEEDFDEDEEILKQGLNSDGTPKRPMNAFMIYARRRRPEVSQDYPSLRTGEISKLLSKEWSGMSQAKKKTFLDLAKKLKDRFNLAHPEYVYKRRPNNSRKKRKNSNAHSTTPTLEQQTVTGPVPIVASNGPEVMGGHHGHPHGYGGYDEYHPHAHHHPHHGQHPHRSGGSLSPPQDLGLNGYTLDAGVPGPSGRTSRSSRMSVSSQQPPYDVAPDDPAAAAAHLYVVSSAGGVQSPHRGAAAPNGATAYGGPPSGGVYGEGDFGAAVAAVNHHGNAYHQPNPHQQQPHLHHPSASSVPPSYPAQQQDPAAISLPQLNPSHHPHHPHHHHHQFSASAAHPHHPALVHQASRESMSGGPPRQHRADSVNSVNGTAMWASPARTPHWNPDVASGAVNGRRTSAASSVSPTSLDHHHPGGNLVENWVAANGGAPGDGGLEGLGLRPVGRHDSIASVASSSVGRPGTAPGIDGPASSNGGVAGWQPPSADMLSPLPSDPALGIRATVPSAGRPHSNSVSSAVGRPHTGSSVGSLSRPHSSSISVMSSGPPSGRATAAALGSFTPINPATTSFDHLSSTPLHAPDLPQQNGGAGLARGTWADWGANQQYQNSGDGSPNGSSHRGQPHEFSTLNSPYYPQGDGSSNTPIAGHDDPTGRMVNGQQQQQQQHGPPSSQNGTNSTSGFHSFQNDQHDVNYHPHHHAQQHGAGEQRFSAADALGGNGQVPGSVDTGNLYSAGTTTTSLPTTASTPPTASAPPTPDYGGPGSGQSHEMIASRSMQEVASFMGGLAGATDAAVHSQNYGLGAVDHHNPYDPASAMGAHHPHHHFAQPVLAAPGGVDSALHHSAGGYWNSVKPEPAV